MAPASSNQPIPASQLETFTTQACDNVFEEVSAGYEHSKVQGWNERIINAVLQDLISSTPSQSYKFAVTSTIIQHLPSPTSPSIEPTTASKSGSERAQPGELRQDGAAKIGMHCASGAYWNEEKDGMWSWKWDGGQRGFDVVVAIWWVAMI